MTVEGPPAYAWDWLARQRIVWREIRRHLIADRPDARTPDARTSGQRFGDVPDWSAEHPDVVRTTPGTSPRRPPAPPGQDYRLLDTRAEVIAALRTDYRSDAAVRRAVDAVVAQVAFLDRLDVPLHALGVRSAPRGMRWWWCHLGGTGLADEVRSTDDAGDEHPASVPTQLRLMDVLAGYGDVPAA